MGEEPLAVNDDYVLRFNRSIGDFFQDAVRLSVRHPALAAFLVSTASRQRAAARLRLSWERQGLHVPPFIIASITRACNLKCPGCYAHAQERGCTGEMSLDQIRRLVQEAAELGISIILLAGGEPLTRRGILQVTREFPGIIFPMFTNGLLIDDAVLEELGGQRHVVPVISLEGREVETDARRGAGVYAHALATMRKMADSGLFCGTSLTVTGRNLETCIDEGFARELVGAGCRLFFFVEFVPAEPGTGDLVLSLDQRELLLKGVDLLRARVPGLFVAFPGDEQAMGGCLAAGRGFFHVSPQGRVEPCPFAPYSDSNLKDMPLREALKSPLLAAIRESEDSLRETAGGCALFGRQEWLESLARKGRG